MSPIMIILLILILSIFSSRTNDLARYKIERNDTFDRKVKSNERAEYPAMNSSRKSQDYAGAKSEKLRENLQNAMSKMVKKIIQQRRVKAAKKWENRRKKEDTNVEKIIDKNNGLLAGLVPVDNNLIRGHEEKRVDDDDGVDDDYNAIIGQNDGAINREISREFHELSETSMPNARGNVRGKMRKVRPNVPIDESRINRDGNYNRGVETKKRGKRASENDAWIKKDFEDHEESFKMQALIVRDEDIPPCCSPAKQVTNRRYFMCSGAVLTLKHAITTASCMHFADIYKHNIDADLGILVGATDPRAYVIKINRYEMHPEYEYDVDSKDYATNNVALIYLECSFVARDVIIPSLPKGINDDVAHMCCRASCDLITIVQGFDNRHTARIIKAQHLPAPRHDDEPPSYREFPDAALEVPGLINKELVPNKTYILARRIRSAIKLAAAPIFFSKEPRDASGNRSSQKNADTSATKKRRKVKTLVASRRKNQAQGGTKKDTLNLDVFADRGKSRDANIPILRALEEEGINIEEQLAAVDWEKIEETMSKKFSSENREAMELFAKKVVDETMKRLGTVLGDDESKIEEESEISIRNGNGNGSTIFGTLMPNDKKNKTIGSFVSVFTKVVASLVPPSSGETIVVSSDASIDDKDLENPPPIYEDCPPLGSPLITDGTLIGLLAYTCDDVQNWVEWRYASIAKNMNWIRKKVSEPYEPVGKCSETEKSPTQARSLPEIRESVSFDETRLTENKTEFPDGNNEWTRREIPSEARNVFPRNFQDIETPVTEGSLGIFKDPWYARNSRLAPRENFNNERIFANTPSRPRISILRNVPVYNVNTCYVKADGTTDCETRTEFNFR